MRMARRIITARTGTEWHARYTRISSAPRHWLLNTPTTRVESRRREGHALQLLVRQLSTSNTILPKDAWEHYYVVESRDPSSLKFWSSCERKYTIEYYSTMWPHDTPSHIECQAELRKKGRKKQTNRIKSKCVAFLLLVIPCIGLCTHVYGLNHPHSTCPLKSFKRDKGGPSERELNKPFSLLLNIKH